MEVTTSKKCTPLWREAHLEDFGSAKHLRSGTLLAVAMSKKCTRLLREEHLEVKMYKRPHVGATYGRPDAVLMSKKVQAVAA